MTLLCSRVLRLRLSPLKQHKATYLRKAQALEKKHIKFSKTLAKCFPGSVQYEHALLTITSLLRGHGYDGDSSIAVVSQCRDEITKPFSRTIDQIWGNSFSISSLGGMIFCGKTGFQAAMAHAPQDSKNRERYVFFVGPHVAISNNGDVGQVEREGRSHKSSACGALQAFRSELMEGHINVQPNKYDREQILLKQELLSDLKYGSVPSLVELTKLCHDIILKDTLQVIDRSVQESQDFLYAVVSGILVHGPDGSNYFCPGEMLVMDDNHDLQKIDLDAPLKINALTEESTEIINDQQQCFRLLKKDYNSLKASEVFHTISITQNGQQLKKRLSRDNIGDVNIVDDNGRSPIQYAAELNKVSSIEALKDLGVECDTLDERGFNISESSYLCGALDSVKYLAQNENLKLRSDFIRSNFLAILNATESLLHLKTLNDHSEGNIVNVSDVEGRTALMYASSMDKLDWVKYLVTKGADINKADNLGNTAIDRAKKVQGSKCLSFFLEEKP